MTGVIRWTFRVLLAVLVLAVLLAIAALLLKDTFAKSLAEKNIRDATGMDATIAKLEVGLLTPTVHLERLRLYNRPEFGGGVFLDLPEMRIEYVPEEIRGGHLRLKTVRLHIAEVTVVRDRNGKTNVEMIQSEAKKKTRGHKPGTDTPGIDFAGIDTLYLTVGKIKVIDLANPGRPQEIPIGLKDEVGHNLKTEADVASWLGAVVLKLYFREMLQGGTNSAIQSLLPNKPRRR